MTPRTPARSSIPWEARMPSRQGVLFAVRARYSTRVHMGLIVLGSMGVALLVTKGLLAAGLDSMFWRYLTATFAAYTAFFVGVWMWLHLSSYGRHLRARRGPREHSFDAPTDLPLPDVSFTPSSPAADGFAGDGGSFDGGGLERRAAFARIAPRGARAAAVEAAAVSGEAVGRG